MIRNLKKSVYFFSLFILLLVTGCKQYIYEDSITLTSMPLKTEYFIGEKLDLTGLVVTTVTEHGLFVDLENGLYTTEPANGVELNEAGDIPVKIKYKKRTLKFNVQVKEVKDTQLIMTSLPKISYYVGDVLDYSDLKIEVKRNNGTTQKLSLSELIITPSEGTELVASGKQTVTIQYENLVIDYEINVYDVLLQNLYIIELPNTTDYYTGDKLDLDGLKLEAVFNDGHTEIITEYGSEPDINTVLDMIGRKQIRINYLDKQVSFFVDVQNSIFAFSEQPKDSSFSLYAQGERLDAQVIVDGDGTVVFEWYRKNPNEDEFVKVYTSDKFDVKFGNNYTAEFNIPQNNYIIADYQCKTILTKGKTIKSVESDVVQVNQVVETEIPLVKINTTTGDSITSKTDYVTASFELTSENYDDLFFDEISIKGRGNTSWNQPKKPYTIKFDKKNKVLGMAKSKKWVLVANYSDKTLLRNYYVSEIGNEIFTGMKWNPAFRPVDLILNNEYMGTYILGEQVKIEENRVNIQSAADTFTGKGEDLNNDGIIDIKDGGFIVEINKRLDENFNFKTKKGICISLKDPDTDDFEKGASDLSEENAEYIKDIIQTAEDVLYSTNWRDEVNGYRNYIDVDSFIDWYIVNEYTKNNDAKWFSSVYMYYNPEDNKLYLGPDWDFDISCGNINYNGCDDYEGFWIKQSGWHARLFNDNIFVEDLKIRWNEIKLDLYNSINQALQNYADDIAKSAKFNFIRWNILGTYVWPNANGYEDRNTYQSEVDYMIEWLNNRYIWMDSAINNL